jgi:hypothetical protein
MRAEQSGFLGEEVRAGDPDNSGFGFREHWLPIHEPRNSLPGA